MAFGNITTIAVAEDDVWLPPVTMYNVSVVVVVVKTKTKTTKITGMLLL